MKLKELYEVLMSGRPQHQPWSLCESRVPSSSYNDLLKWAAGLTDYDIKSHMKLDPSWFGAVLLWLESEVARRYSDERGLWSAISDCQAIRWQSQAHSFLFTHDGQPGTEHKEVLKKAAHHFKLRNAFNVEDTQQWYRLLHLQFGFTLSDAKQRLSAWLSGHTPPVSVDTLLKDVAQGAPEFQALWRSLCQVRLGNISPESFKHRLKDCRWVLPEWCDDLLAAAQASRVVVYDGLEDNHDAFLTTPRLCWKNEEPWFEIELCNLDTLNLTDHYYELKLKNEVVTRLFRRDDGSYIRDTEGRIFLGSGTSIRSQNDFSLVSADGLIVHHSPVSLWNPDRDVNLFQPNSGLEVENHDLKIGQSFDVIASNDLDFKPAAEHTVELEQGYRIHRFKSGWNTPIVAWLDDFELWSSGVFGMPTQPLPYDAIQARLNDGFPFDFRNPLQAKDSPWKVPLEIQIIDKAWRLRGLRWTRADGELWNWSKPPSYLSLVERDIVKPLTLRAILSNGTRTVTVPLKLSVPLIGCFRWTSEGRPYYQDSNRKLSVAEAKHSLWSFYLPPSLDSHGLVSQTNPSQSSLMEGECVRERLRSRIGHLRALAGYGAPAYVSTDPYNSEEHILDLSSSVFDGGILGNVTFQGETASVDLRENFQCGEDHQLYVWLSSKTNPGRMEKVEAKDIFIKDKKLTFPVCKESWLAALVMTFRGERLGSWFDSFQWSNLMLKQNVVDPRTMAGLLRCWKAPILHTTEEIDHRFLVTKWLRENWQEMLPVWLLPKNFVIELAGNPFRIPTLDEHWLEAVNTLLCDVQPIPNPTNHMNFIDKLSTNFNNPSLDQHVGYAVMELVNVCPLLAARTLSTCLQNNPGSLSNKGKDLLHQLIRLFPSNDERAEELARHHGNRDAIWLKSSVSPIRVLEEGRVPLSSTYCKLAKNPEYRKFALGVWLREIQRSLRS